MAEEIKKQSYRDLISRDEKKVKADQIDMRVKEAKHQIDGDIIQAEKDALFAERDLREAMSAIPFNPGDVLQAKQDAKDAADTVAALNDLKEFIGE